MKLPEVLSILASTKYPVAFSHFERPPPMPYLIYLTPYTTNTYADDAINISLIHFQVELYTEYKDEVAEQEVEDALAVFCWEKSQTYLSNEKMFQTIYEFEEIT